MKRKARKARSASNQPAKLWVQRAPWCRGLDEYRTIDSPPGCGVVGAYGYPYLLKHCHVIVDQEKFVKFVQHAWETEVSESDLNVLEYFGLVMPIRKAIVQPLRMEFVEAPAKFGRDHHRPVLKWVHSRWCYTGRAVPKKDRSERAVDLDVDYPEKLTEHDLYMLRPTPFLWSGYHSTYFPTPPASELPNNHPRKGTAFPRRIKPILDGKYYSAASLGRRGRWFRPLHPGYWALLGTGVTYPHDLNEALPKWIVGSLGGISANALQMDARHAYFSQPRVTRFYLLGLGERHSNGHTYGKGQFGYHFGQDWIVSTLVRRLHHRTGLDMALELEHAFRAKRINASRRILEIAAAHWTRLGDRDVAPIPRVIPHFHRNALLWLLMRRRGEVAADRALRDLGELVRLTPRSVQQAVWAGRRALSIN